MATPSISAVPMRWLPWLALAVWLAGAVLGGAAIGSALASRSTPVRIVAFGGAWTGWAVAAVALAFASTVSLTVVRSIVPASVVAGAVAWAAGASTSESVLLIVLGTVSAVIVMSAEFGNAMVQASAYGDETRLGLRPPFWFLTFTVATWAATAALVLVGPLILAANVEGPAGLLALGGGLTALALVALWVFPRRWHLLSRRWLVFVPAGVVVHDRVVLAETLMLRRAEVARMHLAFAGTDALDLTGPATGHALEIAAVEAVTVLKAASTRGGKAQTLHARAILVSPSRPGRALVEAGRRRLSVTSVPPRP